MVFISKRGVVAKHKKQGGMLDFKEKEGGSLESSPLEIFSNGANGVLQAPSTSTRIYENRDPYKTLPNLVESRGGSSLDLDEIKFKLRNTKKTKNAVLKI
jgi:hypothetical protein